MSIHPGNLEEGAEKHVCSTINEGRKQAHRKENRRNEENKSAKKKRLLCVSITVKWRERISENSDFSCAIMYNENSIRLLAARHQYQQLSMNIALRMGRKGDMSCRREGASRCFGRDGERLAENGMLLHRGYGNLKNCTAGREGRKKKRWNITKS